MKTHIHKENQYSNIFKKTLKMFHIKKTFKIDKLIMKMSYIYIYIYIYTQWNYYTAIKKNRILPTVTTWIDLESVMLSEISQTEDKYCMISTYMWNLRKKKKIDKYNWTERVREAVNKQVVAREEGLRKGKEICKYKLSVTK